MATIPWPPLDSSVAVRHIIKKISTRDPLTTIMMGFACYLRSRCAPCCCPPPLPPLLPLVGVPVPLFCVTAPLWLSLDWSCLPSCPLLRLPCRHVGRVESPSTSFTPLLAQAPAAVAVRSAYGRYWSVTLAPHQGCRYSISSAKSPSAIQTYHNAAPSTVLCAAGACL